MSNKKQWGYDEIRIIVDNDYLVTDDMAAKLPDRSRAEIIKKASSLKKRVEKYPEILYSSIFGDNEKFKIPDNAIEVLDVAFDSLSARERDTFIMYYKYGMTLDEVSVYCGITRERIRCILSRGFRKLCHPSRMRILKNDNNYEINAQSDIIELNLSVRSYNALKRHYEIIDTIDDLISRTEYDLMKIRNMGRKCIDEIKEKLEYYGFKLSEEDIQ